MKNTKFYSFYELIEDAKQDLGFSNMRPLYSQIRKLIARAEEEINPYAGYLKKKRMIYYKGNGNFDGKNIKKPEDFVSLDEAGMCNDGLCGNKIYMTPNHIVICDSEKRDKVAFNYWALACDGEGNPVIPRNHKEAILAFIIYKMYAPKVFNGEGSIQLRESYKREWEDYCLASRGADAMPTDKGMQKASQVYKMNRLELDAKYCKDHCTTDTCIETYDDSIGDIYIFQLTDHTQDVVDESDITDAFLESQFKYSKNQVKAGIDQSFSHLGRYGFVLENSLDENIQILDILGNNIISSMNVHFDYEKQRTIFVSKEYITPSTIHFQINYE